MAAEYVKINFPPLSGSSAVTTGPNSAELSDGAGNSALIQTAVNGDPKKMRVAITSQDDAQFALGEAAAFDPQRPERHHDAETAEDGEVEGYRVHPQQPPVAPHPPHAYVQLDEVREATLEERARFNRELEQSASADRPTPAGPDPRPDPTPDAETEARPDPEVPANPAPAPMPTPPMTGQPTPDATEPADPQPADARPAVTGGEPQREQTQPAAQPDAQPATQPAAPPDPQPEATPADQPDDAEEPSAEAEAESPEGEPTQEEPTPEPEPLDIEELEAEFLRIRRLGRQPLDDALDEIVGEYRRTLATLEAPAFIRIAESRLEWLELRRATRDERRDLEAALQAANGRTQAIRERLEAIERTRRYAVVGRLVPSPLYDGDPLPLMYRVESVGGREASRTLGYVRPRAGDDLAAKLGELVGVVGDVRIDRSLGLLLIRPVRVDVLTTE